MTDRANRGVPVQGPSALTISPHPFPARNDASKFAGLYPLMSRELSLSFCFAICCTMEERRGMMNGCELRNGIVQEGRGPTEKR